MNLKNIKFIIINHVAKDINMNYTIIIGEHCYGPFITINGESLIDEIKDELILNDNLISLVFSWLNESLKNFQKDELENIAEILHYRDNQKFSLTEEEYELAGDIFLGKFICNKFNYDAELFLQELNNSKANLDLNDWRYILDYLLLVKDSLLIISEFESCDQCGNPNYTNTYTLNA